MLMCSQGGVRFTLIACGGLMTALLVAASEPQFGELRLQTQPGAEVIWESVALGTVGSSGLMEIGGIPLGEYAVAVQREGFLTRSSRLTIGPGIQEVDLELAPVSRPSPDADSKPAERLGLPDPLRPASWRMTIVWLCLFVLVCLGGVVLVVVKRRRGIGVGRPYPEPISRSTSPFRSHGVPEFYESLRQRELDLERIVDPRPERPRLKLLKSDVGSSDSHQEGRE